MTPAAAPTVAEEVHTMGTVVSFTVWPGRLSPTAAREALAAAAAVLHDADAVFSTWQPASPMSRLRRGEISLGQAPPVVAEVLELCRRARVATGGWFDPWALPGGVDPTGLVKGWALQRAAAVLAARGVEAALVNGGGDIATVGLPAPGQPWRVGIRHPFDAGALACILKVTGSVATSGSYERGEHLVDPRTGRPGTRCASATVTGPDLALADAFATALAVAGPGGLEHLRALTGYSAYLIRDDATGLATPGIVMELPDGPG